MTTYDKILGYNRHPKLSDFFKTRLEELISYGVYHNQICPLYDDLVRALAKYKIQHNKSTVIVGMSGGIDSALTAALFKDAGYRVIGMVLPIDQNPIESALGHLAIDRLGIEGHEIDLTEQYNCMLDGLSQVDQFIKYHHVTDAIRRGNVRARLRMTTLYNMASRYHGFVASTDNFSELAAGFWTLHGDVGDVAPIQSLLKSWEVPALAEVAGVPKEIINAIPTDGLGISSSDEDQLGVSYLEFDIALLSILKHMNNDNLSEEDYVKFDTVIGRVSRSEFKRNNPHNINHPFYPERLSELRI